MFVAPPPFWISVRFLIAVLAFFGYAVQYMQRINISVAMICMVNNTALTGANQTFDTNVTIIAGTNSENF